jgi:X-Pro dipeptidyl-peptidase
VFRRGVLVAALAFAAVAGPAGVVVTQAHADATATTCTPDELDNLDPCIYSYDDAVVSHVQVPVPPTTVDALDTQGAPAVDTIWVDYLRPAVPAGVTMPTIMDASPYFNTLGRGYLDILKTPYDANAPQPPNALCGGCPTADFPEWESHYFVPRGYAIALIDLRGTRNSTGCEVYGDQQEALDAVAVTDWIADQDWSNGKVGMIGGSYDGTIANGAAALYPTFGKHDPDTLAAIVPIRAIDRWYDYQFFNGVEANGQEADPEEFSAVFPVDDWPNSGPTRAGGSQTYPADLAHREACPGIEQIPTDAGYASPYQDTVDGSTSNFWHNRDYLQYAKTWRAATFFIHGLYDFNVKTMNAGQLWDSLPSSVPKRLWWLNGDHDDPDTPDEKQANDSGFLMPYPFMQKFETEVHRWFLHYLKGVDAGAGQQPAVEVQRDDGHWDGYARYPADPSYGDDTVLHFSPDGAASSGDAASGSVTWADGASSAPNSQSFVSDPVTHDTRLSGQFAFDLDIAAQGPDTTIAVEVDDVPPGAGAGLADENVAGNTKAFAFNFAYIRPFYRDSIRPRGASYPTNGSPLSPGQHYRVHFPSTYMDYVLHAGHRLRFVIADSSPYSLAAEQGNTVTMFTGTGADDSLVDVPEVDYDVPAATLPELGGGWLGLGGPATALLLGCYLILFRQRRLRRRHNP